MPQYFNRHFDFDNLVIPSAFSPKEICVCFILAVIHDKPVRARSLMRRTISPIRAVHEFPRPDVDYRIHLLRVFPFSITAKIVCTHVEHISPAFNITRTIFGYIVFAIFAMHNGSRQIAAPHTFILCIEDNPAILIWFNVYQSTHGHHSSAICANNFFTHPISHVLLSASPSFSTCSASSRSCESSV